VILAIPVAKGEVGAKATDALLAMDLGNNPQDYLTVNRGLTERGTFAFQLTNKTSRPLTGIKLGLNSGSGDVVQNVGGTLPPGKSTIVDTGRRMSKAQADAIKVRVVDVNVKR